MFVHMEAPLCVPSSACVACLSHPMAPRALLTCFLLLKVNAVSCAGSVDNLVMLDPERYKSLVYDVAMDSNFAMCSQYKWKAGELEFESLMRMLDNLVSPCAPLVRQGGNGEEASQGCVLCCRVTGRATPTGSPSCEKSQDTRAMLRSPPRSRRSCSRRTWTALPPGCP